MNFEKKLERAFEEWAGVPRSASITDEFTGLDMATVSLNAGLMNWGHANRMLHILPSDPLNTILRSRM